MKIRRCLCCAMLLVLGATAADAAFEYVEDFSAGLTTVVVTGDVSVVNEEARLGDNGVAVSYVYPPVATPNGAHTLEFEFLNNLSSDVPPGTFPDTFFASLYFIDDINQFDLLGGVADDVIPLFDMEAAGLSLLDGEVTPSGKGNGWLHFATTFNNSYAFVMPSFEVHNLNFIDGDSAVFLDDIIIRGVPIPEPGSLILLMSGLVTCLAVRRYSRVRGGAT